MGQSTLFTHATIITVDAEQTIWLDGALFIHEDRIGVIGQTQTLLDEHSLGTNVEIIDCHGQIIIPGLINTHAHLGQSLLRGLAEDLALHDWLCDAIWPLEACYEKDDGYVAARLTIAEMLRTGTTCFLEALLTPRSGFENVSRAVAEMGIRACLGKLTKVEDLGKADALADPRDRDISSMSIKAVIAAHETYHGTCDGRLHVWVAAVTPRGSQEAAHKAIGDACAERSIGLTMHCAEAPKDLDIYHESYDCSPVEFCEKTNLIGPGRKTVLAHMVNLDLDKDLPLLAKLGGAVAHNPSSNCKLASGIAAVPEMLAAGVTVGLGTDGAPCANTYDMIFEMRMAALIQKGSRREAAAMKAEQVLKMATIDGARALGLERDIGSIEVDKKADLVFIDASSLSCTPFNPNQAAEGGMDPITAVVFSCSGADVCRVIVDGNVLVENKRLVVSDESTIKRDAVLAIRNIRQRCGKYHRIERNYK